MLPAGCAAAIFAGLEIVTMIALIGAIVAECVGLENGPGMLIQGKDLSMDVAGQFPVLLILSAIGLALNARVTVVLRRVLSWDASGAGNGAITGRRP